MEWDIIEKELNQLRVSSKGENELVIVKGHYKKLECIGVGTDAAVFRFSDAPKYAFKVFSDDKLGKLENEIEVYRKLGPSEYFPVYYGRGLNYLVMSFEEGITLYDCLLKGIHIPKQIILDVDEAINYGQSKGLNPRDIHLKNILLQEGRAKLLDVSEYLNPGNDKRWEYLKEGYLEHYHLIDGKALPLLLIETVRKWYNQTSPESLNVHDVVKALIMLFRMGT
ncbi:serine/threonine protein kinase [Desulfosporosinus sp.]|uniref:serine/threonine protein kinase n=1 Tax=Desulfosporosinus sp. TaxID=157907 RepID=UPI000E8A3F4E|nr:serine/threonine protein kinase [Desulfosporosinus sp.]MBC2722607.1 protein kinase family protein [Desulfosporosinus sp.]MBC2727733.1 protein kinase family protein [Desulfosporosinus sp.]HBV86436.1 serine/threonine protein kinase [Desulfosporosinus sp.]